LIVFRWQQRYILRAFFTLNFRGEVLSQIKYQWAAPHLYLSSIQIILLKFEPPLRELNFSPSFPR
jgi:hypothetical protein